MANASKKHGMGHGQTVGHPTTGIVDDGLPEQEDLDIHGTNRPIGNTQARTQNQRQSQADETNEPPETDEFVQRHRAGLQSGKTGLTEEQVEKLANKP